MTLSLLLISQGVGQNDFTVRVALVRFGTLGLLVVFLHILGERTELERQLATRLHLSAARLAIRDEPDAAIASLKRAEEHARRSMQDIGSVVRLLHADEAATSPPSPQLDDLPALIESFRAAGADIPDTGSGALGHLPVTAALSAYRIVQEGLTNAVRHGPCAERRRGVHQRR